MKRFRAFFSLLLAALLVFGCCIPAAAAGVTASITASASKPTVGSTFTVTVRYTASGMKIGTVNAMLHYNADLLDFVSGESASNPGAGVVYLASGNTDAVTSYTFSMQFRAKAVGAAAFSLAYDGGMHDGALDNDTEKAYTPSASLTVQTANPTLSGNANLASLKISAGTLSPRFSANTVAYTISVPNSVSTLTVSAVAADAGAKVAISGGNSLAVGVTVRTVTVTAPNGTTKTYTLRITRAAAATTSSRPASSSSAASTSSAPAETSSDDPLHLERDGNDYYVAFDWQGETPPTGFSVDTLTYAGQTVPCAHSPDGSLTLLYLLNAARDAGRFYLYDAATGAFSPFSWVTSDALTYVLLDPPTDFTPPAGYTTARRTLGEQEATVYVLQTGTGLPDASADFCLVYALAPSGNRGLYQYDAVEKTMQRYLMPTALPTDAAVEPEAGLLQTIAAFASAHRLPLICAAALLAAVLAAVLLVVLVRRTEKHRAAAKTSGDALEQEIDSLVMEFKESPPPNGDGGVKN